MDADPGPPDEPRAARPGSAFPRRQEPTQPESLRRAAVVVAVEGLALALLGIGYAVSGVVGEPEDRLATVLAGLLALLVGVGLVLAGRGLAHERHWALSPTVLAQLLLVVVGVGLLQGGVLAVGLPVVGLGVAVLALLAQRSTRDVFRDAG